MIMFWVLLCQDRLASSRPSCFARQLESEHFGNCEKDSASVRCANKGLCPFETCKPFFEGLDPKIYCFCLPKSYKNRPRKFRIEPFLKGSWVSRGQIPPFADIANAEPFSQFHNPPDPIRYAAGRTQNIIKKPKRPPIWRAFFMQCFTHFRRGRKQNCLRLPAFRACRMPPRRSPLQERESSRR